MRKRPGYAKIIELQSKQNQVRQRSSGYVQLCNNERVFGHGDSAATARGFSIRISLNYSMGPGDRITLSDSHARNNDARLQSFITPVSSAAGEGRLLELMWLDSRHHKQDAGIC